MFPILSKMYLLTPVFATTYILSSTELLLVGLKCSSFVMRFEMLQSIQNASGYLAVAVTTFYNFSLELFLLMFLVPASLPVMLRQWLV